MKLHAAPRRRAVLAAALACAVPLSRALSPLRLARIENVPDQQVGAQILQAVYDRLGVPVAFVDVPARRALTESSAGRLDGEVHRVLDVEREYPTLLPVREPINVIEPSVFTRGRELRVDGWASIAPYAVGIVRGVGSSERGTAGLPRVEAFASMEQLMQVLAAGRVDLAVNDRFSGLLVARRLGLENELRPLEPPLQRIPLYHFLHERHRALVPRVEEEVRAMRASGELPRLQRELTERMLREARR